MNARSIALPLLLVAGLAQAGDIEALPYRYGSQPDIAEVLRIEMPSSNMCEITTAVMTYRDSAGTLRKMTYLVSSDACTKQN